jgi:hypothetical protein
VSAQGLPGWAEGNHGVDSARGQRGDLFPSPSSHACYPFSWRQSSLPMVKVEACVAPRVRAAKGQRICPDSKLWGHNAPLSSEHYTILQWRAHTRCNCQAGRNPHTATPCMWLLSFNCSKNYYVRKTEVVCMPYIYLEYYFSRRCASKYALLQNKLGHIHIIFTFGYVVESNKSYNGCEYITEAILNFLHAFSDFFITSSLSCK